MSEKMTTARAAEILDPAHRESYESLGVVEEACRMGREALLLRIPRSPFPDGKKSTYLACPNCGSEDYLHNAEDEERNDYCGKCGQAIDWAEVYDG
jgi:ribosomal protein S27AE